MKHDRAPTTVGRARCAKAAIAFQAGDVLSCNANVYIYYSCNHRRATSHINYNSVNNGERPLQMFVYETRDEARLVTPPHTSAHATVELLHCSWAGKQYRFAHTTSEGGSHAAAARNGRGSRRAGNGANEMVQSTIAQ